METVADYKEIVDEIKANGGEAFNRCYQCGLCDAVCPWNRLINFSMRKIVRQATFGMTDIESEDIWRCTTCGSCPQQCPRDVGQVESAQLIDAICDLEQAMDIVQPGLAPQAGIHTTRCFLTFLDKVILRRVPNQVTCLALDHPGAFIEFR